MSDSDPVRAGLLVVLVFGKQPLSASLFYDMLTCV